MESVDFALPRGVTGLGRENLAEAEQRQDAFLNWARSLATAHGSKTVELSETEPWPSFATVRLERLDVWLLHNRYVPLVGALSVAPEPGPSWAAAGTFVDVAVPEHAVGWGPQLLRASVLNATLGSLSLTSLALTEQQLADRYKPATVGHVIYNYWS